MSGLFGKVSGTKNLKKKMDDASTILEKAMADSVKSAALSVHRNAVMSIQQTSVGEKSTRYNPLREHIASKPGDAPNTDRGTLVKSIQFEFDDDGKTARVGTNLKYGAHLEFGTENMSARPWLLPAFEKTTADIAKTIQKNFNTGVRKGFGIQTDILKELNNIKRSAKRTTKSVSKKAKRARKKISRAARSSKRAVNRGVKSASTALRNLKPRKRGR